MVDLAVDGQPLPVYVKDTGGKLLPDATIAADSGFDYLHPVPEPRAVLGALATGLTETTWILSQLHERLACEPPAGAHRRDVELDGEPLVLGLRVLA